MRNDLGQNKETKINRIFVSLRLTVITHVDVFVVFLVYVSIGVMGPLISDTTGYPAFVYLIIRIKVPIQTIAVVSFSIIFINLIPSLFRLWFV